MNRQLKIPDTPAGRHIDACLEIANTSDWEIIQNSVTQHYDRSVLERYPLFILNALHKCFYYLSAGLGYDLTAVQEQGDYSLRLVLRNKLTERCIGIEVNVSTESPHKIVEMLQYVNIDEPSPDFFKEKTTDEIMTNKLEQCIQKMDEDNYYSGAVILAKNDSILLRNAWGMANRSFMVPNRIDTKFNIASMGKMFTGVAIAQLQEHNKLQFTDPVDRYITPDWLDPAIARKIQIQHLLTHTSGLGDYFPLMYQKHPMTYYRYLDDYQPLMRDIELAFEPGTQWAYSNVGMLLLGVVIEKLTGGSYDDYIHENIYQRAGMVNSGAFEADHVIPNLAIGYSKMETPGGMIWRNNQVKYILKGGPSGGSYSTVEDMVYFDKALRDNLLLRRETMEIVLSAKPALNSPFYGYGFFVSTGASGHCVRHGGDGRGINSQFRSYLDKGYTLVALSNTDPPGANIISDVCDALLAY